MGCHTLLQGIFLTQEWNPGLLQCGQIFYQGAAREAHAGPHRVLLSSTGSLWPRTWVGMTGLKGEARGLVQDERQVEAVSPYFCSQRQGLMEEGPVGLWRCSELRFWGNGRVSRCAGRQAVGACAGSLDNLQ